MATVPSGEQPTSFGIQLSPNQKKVFFIVVACLCASPLVTAPLALLFGILMAQVTGIPFPDFFKKNKVTQRLLQYSVVGLGFGMSIKSAIEAGKQGILFTVSTIFGTLIMGALLGMFFKIDRKTTHLISSGTAICGGSAIAAVAPVIKADEKQISVALGIVFILNSVALFVFPWLGHYLHMTETQFGLWSALAIHDTSSVVGAAKFYGPKALEVATVVKLARALWIIPLAIATAFFFKDGKQKIKIPYFIGFFILAMLVNTYFPAIHSIAPILVKIAKAGLVLTLFFIGASLSIKTIKSVGARPLILGILLWFAIAGVSLMFILQTVA